MALAFLPAEHIVQAFAEVRASIRRFNDPRLTKLAAYFQDTWINSTVWPPQSCSVFKETVHTNNDVEGEA